MDLNGLKSSLIKPHLFHSVYVRLCPAILSVSDIQFPHLQSRRPHSMDFVKITQENYYILIT